MNSSAWQHEDQSKNPKGKPIWLQALIAFSAGLLIFLIVMGLQIRHCRVTAWQGFRSVMAEIRTESDAKALFRRSPGLARRFTDEAHFWEYLKSYQSVIQIPPAIEPVNDGNKYLLFPLPTSSSIRFRSENGTTFSVSIMSPGLFRSSTVGHEVIQRFNIQATRMLTVNK